MASHSAYLDDRETRSPDERAARQWEALRAALAHAKARSRYWAGVLADIDPEAVQGPADLTRITLKRKSALPTLQSQVVLGGMDCTCESWQSGDYLSKF